MVECVADRKKFPHDRRSLAIRHLRRKLGLQCQELRRRTLRYDGKQWKVRGLQEKWRFAIAGDDSGIAETDCAKDGIDFTLAVVFYASPTMAALAYATQGAEFIGLRLNDCLLQSMEQSLAIF